MHFHSNKNLADRRQETGVQATEPTSDSYNKDETHHDSLAHFPRLTFSPYPILQEEKRVEMKNTAGLRIIHASCRASVERFSYKNPGIPIPVGPKRDGSGQK
jgi:hypothetical protein